MDNDDVDFRERQFHNAVREYIIWGLLFVVLYVISYFTICAYKRKVEREDYFFADAEDALVYRIALWLCTFTLAVAEGAVLLLPISMLANEALLVFPNNYYLQWVQASLIHGLWNQIFLASNLALFILMPFAYLFTESEGLPGSRKGIMSRLKETVLVLTLLAILVCGLAWVASAILGNDKESRKALFDIWNFYLPYLYSLISLLGVLMLLICTPVGFAWMFTVVGNVVVRPKFLQDLDLDLQALVLEEEAIKRRLYANGVNSNNSNGRLANGHSNHSDLESKLDDTKRDRLAMEKRLRLSSFRRNLSYPLVMLLLLALTGICVLMVSLNAVELLIGFKALPGSNETVLGLQSLSTLGTFGTVIQIVVIFYLMVSSVVGFYSLPLLRRLRPVRKDTPMTKVIGNCSVLLILSSALPVLSRALGITNFDLLGNFGRLEWLGNFQIVLAYNVIFSSATALCLFTKFTAAVRREIFNGFQQVFLSLTRTKRNARSDGSKVD